MPRRCAAADHVRVRLWTLQAPEVVAALHAEGEYLADWATVPGDYGPAYRAVVAEMARRGIDSAGAPPIWCWTWRSPLRLTANLLLSDQDWAHGRWLLALDAPDRLTLSTSYAGWNDYLCYTMGFAEETVEMDWSGRLLSAVDQPQVTLPELRADWVLWAREFPPDAETVARIAANPIVIARDVG